MRKRILIILLVFWIAFIFYNSLQPGYISGANSGRIAYEVEKILQALKINIDINTIAVIIRKGAHIFEFTILAALFYQVLNNYVYSSRILLTFVFSVTIGIIDETIQLFIEGRSGNIIDVGFDTIGVIVGIGLSIIIEMLIRKAQNKKLD